MENMNFIPQGGVPSVRIGTTENEGKFTNPIAMQSTQPNFESVSKKYADAWRAITMARINLDNKPAYRGAPTYYKS